MKTVTLKRVTIVGENSLEERMVKEAHELGATGYTYTVVHGEGAKGLRPSTWNGPNAKIEIIATAEIAERILEHVAKNYFESYAVIAYVDDVQVVRPEKFGGA
jgi:nitrogen regulatory protein PII